MKQQRHFILYLFAFLFLFSGAAGLVYQIVWARLLELYFGVTMVSVTLIVSAYMAGLGIGSLIGGRIARNVRNTLLQYGFLEIGIALFGVISPTIIVGIGQATAGVSYILVFFISFAVLLIPTTLMGMTLPLLTQSFVDRAETSGRVIGLLYGINTLGAAFGALFSGYVLIGAYGFEGTIYIAVLLNGLVGVVALFLARWQADLAVQTEANPSAGSGFAVWGYKTILVSSFLVGFIGLGFEMLWVRILLIVNKNTAYSFPSILFVFLLGLALGGYYWGRKADASRNPVALFCQIELAGAAIAALTFVGFGLTVEFGPPWIENFFDSQKPAAPFFKDQQEFIFSRRLLLSNLWDYFLPILIMVLPASLILGGGLPVLDRVSIQNPNLSGRRVGDIHLANILGSVAGALVVSFLWLPAFGSEWTMRLLILCTLLFPALYFFDKTKAHSMRSRDYPLITLSALALVSVILLPRRGEFYQGLYATGTSQNAVISESGDSVLALTYEPESARQAGVFWIGGEVNSFFPPEGIYESRALTCAGASKPERVLIIGFGGGFSALFYQSIPQVNDIVIVELLGNIAPFLESRLHSAQLTLNDPRVTYLVDDGRRYLNAFPDEKFELISIDPLRDHTAGHNNLYSEEALRIYRNHLTPNGVLCAWMDEFHIIPHTVASVFSYVDQFENEFMVAGNNPIAYDTEYMARSAEGYANLTEDLYGADGRVNLNATSTLDLFLRDQDQILADEKNKQVLRDMNPWLEYYLFVRPVREEIHRNPDVMTSFERRIR
ncbi:MAG TPA: fused MFS/spermidine synthase [Anaerolineales bacterium]